MTQTEKDILDKTREYVKKIMSSDTSGHDFHHVERVARNARIILKKEKADHFVVMMACYLHDLDDPKLVRSEKDLTRKYLASCPLDKEKSERILKITEEISFSKQKEGINPSSQEAMIVQDADRLDALGAIGIARCYAYGGHESRPLFTGKRNDDSSTAHFYQKLYVLKDLMNTGTARRIAIKKTRFMKKYVRLLEADCFIPDDCA